MLSATSPNLTKVQSVAKSKSRKSNRIAPIDNNKITKYFTFRDKKIEPNVEKITHDSSSIPFTKNSQKSVKKAGTKNPPKIKIVNVNNSDQGDKEGRRSNSDLEGGTEGREEGGTTMSKNGEKVINGGEGREEVAVDKEE